MKSSLVVFMAVLMLLAAPGVRAQVQHEIALTRADISTERQAIVAENLPLSEEQAKAFWPMYRTYREEVAKVGDSYVNLIEKYAKSYDTMTDVDAMAMLKEFFELQSKQVSIKKAWAPKFEKVIPAKSVARFFQIENKLDLIVLSEVSAEIPLVQTKK